MEERERQMSESLLTGILLAIGGGFMDAYSFILRGGVFANAQTGNIVLLGISISHGDLHSAIPYLLPVILFVFGIIISEMARYIFDFRTNIHWRHIVLIIEIVILFCVAFIPQSINSLACCLISLTCGMQAQTFAKINGHGVATTMCTGNLRSAVTAICLFFKTKEFSEIRKALIYISLILFFILGAIIGNYCIKLFAEKSIICCNIFLFIGFFLMIDNKKTFD